jgi:hypothetical protein
VTVTASSSYPVTATGSGSVFIQALTPVNVVVFGNTFVLPVGPHFVPAGASFVSGTFLTQSGGSGIFTIPSGGVTAASTGVDVTVNSGAIITGPALTPIAPIGLAAAAPAASALGSSPGLAGTAGIQPQLNVDGLLAWAQTVSGADVAADLAVAPA